MGLEEGAFAGGNAFARGVEEGSEEGIDFCGVAVVGVEGDEDIVFFGEAVDGFGEDDGAEGGVADVESGSKLATASGDLDDAVGLGIGEGLEGTIRGCERRDIDGWIGVAVLLSSIEHILVLFWCRNRHELGHSGKGRSWQGCDRKRPENGLG